MFNSYYLMENIQIIDNFLNNDELIQLNKIVYLKNWNFHSSGGYEIIDNKFFSTVNEDVFFLEKIKSKIESSIKKNTILLRHYMHIQTFGQDGGFHVDSGPSLEVGLISPFEENNTLVTFCLYITDLTNETLDTAGGDFLIKIPNNKYIVNIKTIMNRGILFPSQYIHKGNAYTSGFTDKRLCLTWKLKII